MNQDRYLEKNAQVCAISQDKLKDKLIETMRTIELRSIDKEQREN